MFAFEVCMLSVTLLLGVCRQLHCCLTVFLLCVVVHVKLSMIIVLFVCVVCDRLHLLMLHGFLSIRIRATIVWCHCLLSVLLEARRCGIGHNN